MGNSGILTGHMAEITEGLKVVLTPIQLAAILQGEPIGAHEILMNRLWGGAKIVAGASELIVGSTFLLTPEPTLLTKAAGGVLLVHGTDTFASGIREAWSGESNKTLTQQAGEQIAYGVGATPKQAERTGIVLDVAVPLLGAAATTAARITSIRAGRIALAEHEALGGHTILKHVGKTEGELRTRLLAEPGLPAASSFSSLRTAESVISEALKAEGTSIRAWAATGQRGRYRMIFPAGRSVGYGVVRATDKLVEMHKVRCVLQATQQSGKLYFVLTAFPIP